MGYKVRQSKIEDKAPAFEGALPSWFKREIPSNPEYTRVKHLLEDLKLNTVCKEAKCPNVGECYSRGTATFMVLGDICTRNCRFCAIDLGKPRDVDAGEPARLREAVATLGLKHVVVTMVTRDDLADGGAAHVAEVIAELKSLGHCSVEVLTSDFAGHVPSWDLMAEAAPDIFNHNIETVRRLHPDVRPMMVYERSLEILRYVKEKNERIITKSGMMVGLGEQAQEVFQTLEDLRAYGCDVVTIGQYLRPPNSPLKVCEYVRPEHFAEYKRAALDLGFIGVESGALVRSSYRADEAVKRMKEIQGS